LNCLVIRVIKRQDPYFEGTYPLGWWRHLNYHDTPERVWRRRHPDSDDSYSERAYAGGNGLFALLAMAITLIGQQYTFKLGIDPNGATALLVVLIVLMFAGILLMAFSSHPPVSFVGLIVLSGSFGILLGVWEPGIAVPPLVASVAVAIVLALVGYLLPASLHRWGSWLLGLTTALIIVSVMMPFIESYGVEAGTYQRPAWLDVVTVILFSAWMIYDWNRARRMPRTLDNMIDNGGAIYLDWLNIYLALKNIFGNLFGED
jgi:FtsH-binding integral membrane protein